MSIVLVISSIALVIGIGCLLLDYLNNDEDFGAVGIVLILLSIGFGFVMLGTVAPVEEKKVSIRDYEIFKSSYRVIVDTNKGQFTSTDMKYQDIAKDNIKVFQVKNINSYGFTINDSIEIERK